MFLLGCLYHSLLKMIAQDEQQWREIHAKSNNCQRLQSSKDTCNNKLEGVGPLPLLMVSSKRTGGAIYGFIEGRQGGNREPVGPLPLSGGSIDSFIKGHQGGRKQETPHTQRDMCNVSLAICSLEGVGSICFFSNFNWSIERRGVSPLRNPATLLASQRKKQGVPTKSRSSSARATSESTNSTA